MRYIESAIKKDLKKKMVFIAGPRQCGKTTLVKHLLEESKKSLYLNWDNKKDKKIILDGLWDDSTELVAFDEIHKYKNWKNLVKGYYDTEKEKRNFIITGSARLDVYRRGGDSLLGRYHHWRLHPFSLFEIPEKLKPQEVLKRLMSVGGFPEPFFDNSEREARRWRQERTYRILRDDIRDLENIKQMDTMEQLLFALRARVGSTISYNSLAEDLQVSPHTIKNWIEIFEKMYLVFTVRAYTKGLGRSVQKPFKCYFYDIAEVENGEPAKFENLVALHLLQKVHYIQDYEGYKIDLHFLRDKEKHEVDFLINFENKPIEMIEVKYKKENLSNHLDYFQKKLNIPKKTQIVMENKTESTIKGTRLTNPISYFTFDSILKV